VTNEVKYLAIAQIYMVRRKVRLYTDGSKTSDAAMECLKAAGVEFEEVDCSKPEGRAMLVRSTRQTVVPFLEVRSSHGVSTSSGFDEFLYASALDPTLSRDRFTERKLEGRAHRRTSGSDAGGVR